MRRRRSDELPRYLNERPQTFHFRWRRRYALYLVTAVVIYWFMYPPHRSSSTPSDSTINWSNYAYSLYATDDATLCHAVLVAEALDRVGSQADRVLFYPNYWDLEVSDSKDRDSQLLLLARDRYKVKLHPIELLSVAGRTKDAMTGTWDKSVTKLMAFSLEYYDRVIALDSDMTLLQSLDELFLLPQTPIAMPRAYWVDSKPWPLTTMLMVIKPNHEELDEFKRRMARGGDGMLVNAHKFDMELVNERFEESAMVLPHRPYALLTGEFRRRDHSTYLGNSAEKWDAEKAFKEAKLVHFSDWPLPKPWIMWPTQGLQEMQPDCGGSKEGTCPERRIWKHLYDDFRHRRHDICKLLSVPAPEWSSIKTAGGGLHNETEVTAHAAPHADSSSS